MATCTEFILATRLDEEPRCKCGVRWLDHAKAMRPAREVVRDVRNQVPLWEAVNLFAGSKGVLRQKAVVLVNEAVAAIVMADRTAREPAATPREHGDGREGRDGR